MVPKAERDLLLELHNQPILQLGPGMMWLPVIYEVETDLEVR